MKPLVPLSNDKKYIKISVVKSHFVIIFAFLRTNPGLTNTFFAGICNQDISFHPYQSNITNHNRNVRRALLKCLSFFVKTFFYLVNRVHINSV